MAPRSLPAALDLFRRCAPLLVLLLAPATAVHGAAGLEATASRSRAASHVSHRSHESYAASFAEERRASVARQLSGTAALAAATKLAPSQLQALLALDAAWGVWRLDESAEYCWQWNFVQCDSLGMVTNLTCGKSINAGAMDPAISNLTSLQELDVAESNLTGSFDFMASLPASMQHLDLSGTKLSGELPVSIGSATKLTYLNLEFLNFTRLPAWISSLSSLEYLDVSGITGQRMRTAPFPTEWTALKKLQNLYADGNGFTGSIPSTISALSSLTHLSLGYNYYISGSIPDTLSTLKSLYYLRLATNNLSGSIPPSFTALSSLAVLNIKENPLSGGLEALSNMKEIFYLIIGSCNFSGPFPELKALKSMDTLDISNNRFTGTFPAVALRTSVTHINMSRNAFTGAIPSAISNLLYLSTLDLHSNAFTGTLPDVRSYDKLAELDYGSNQFTGALPTSYSRMSSLQLLNVNENQLSGPIPASVGSLANLWSFNTTASGLTCQADGSKCVVQQQNTSTFCQLCYSFCSSCTPLK
ncbi:unnamed protein product, partial [Closterium sp. NIES-65]